MTRQYNPKEFVEGPLRDFLTINRRPTGPRVRQKMSAKPMFVVGDVIAFSGFGPSSRQAKVARVIGANCVELDDGSTFRF